MNCKIADTVFGLKFIDCRLERFFKDYITDEPAEFYIENTDKDIDDNKSVFAVESRTHVELLLIHKHISTYLLEKKDGFLFHASAIKVGGDVIMFTAPSGTGKSTQARHWKEAFPDEVTYVNDDKPFIRREGGRFIVYGSPWNGKHRLGENTSAPLKCICFLCRGEERVERISAFDAAPLLFNQTLCFKDPEDQLKLLSLLDELVKTVDLFRIYCTDTDDSGRKIRALLKENLK